MNVVDARPPDLRDAALGAVVMAALLAAGVAELGPVTAQGRLDAVAVVIAAAIGGAAALRRRFPVSTLVAFNAGVFAWFAGGYPGSLVLLGPLLGCYTLAVRRGWVWALAGAVPTAVLQVLAVRLVLGDTRTAGVVPIWVLLVATAASAGAAVGYYRAALATARAQLAREAELREERATSLLVGERLRIAQELHDIIGHAMATVSVQAGVALHVLDRQPNQARETLEAIKAICDESLDDVRSTLGVLRTGDAPREPRGRLPQLAELVATVEDAGLHVELRVDGEERPLPTPVDLAVYRIIQEALTNVLRHAHASTVWLTVTHEPDRVLVHVRDDGTAPPGDRSSGHGISGMRERARAFSGRLAAAAHPDGGFEVRAELPLPARR
ncbi:sensor histidine kinase [Pseudonocardia sp. CA-107938]|uniref:sensor histidine kinase n=1 Tax=Pseudonocardia sp. CA-107938 TaxID=3240021 RepID=UPI003D8D6EAC